MTELGRSQEEERHSLDVLFQAAPFRTGDTARRTRAPPTLSITSIDIYFLLSQNKNMAFNYFELYRGCCGRSEVALLPSLASCLFFLIDFPCFRSHYIFSLKTSSVWYLTVILVLMSSVILHLHKGVIFPIFYQELSCLSQSIQRLVAKKAILV